MTGGKYKAKFPIIVKVYTEQQADEVLTYDASLQKIIKEVDPVAQVRMALELEGSDTILKELVDSSEHRGYYPVVWGQRCGIFLS